MSKPLPMHLARPGGAKVGPSKRRAAGHAAEAPAVSYPPGFFTALIRQHNWPPQWQPAPEPEKKTGWTPEHGQRCVEHLRQQRLGFFAPGMGLGLAGAATGPAPAVMRRPPTA